jgi:regulator of PEP synthase PpsR (kinase-PPPase family)
MGSPKRQYAQLEEIYDELDHAAAIHRRLGCPVLEVTEASIEENAHRIIRLVAQRRAEAKAS